MNEKTEKQQEDGAASDASPCSILYSAEYNKDMKTLYILPLGKRTWVISKRDLDNFYLFVPLKNDMKAGEHYHSPHLADVIAKAESHNS